MKKLLVAILSFYVVYVPAAIIIFPSQGLDLVDIGIILLVPLTVVPLLIFASLEEPLLMALLLAVFSIPAALFYYGREKASNHRLSLLLTVSSGVALSASVIAVIYAVGYSV